MATAETTDTDVQQESEPVTHAELDKMRGEFHRLLKKEARVPVEDNGEFAIYLDTARFEHCWRIAELFSRSKIVPESFQGEIEDCFIAVQMAIRCGVDPFMFLQKCYVVNGRPAIESQLAIALANKSGVFKHRLSYDMSGDGDKRQCVCSGIIAESGDLVEEVVSVKQAKDMGWWTKKGSLWPGITDLMLKYRSAMWLIRTNCPEVLMGIRSKEEIDDMDGQPTSEVPSELPQTLDGIADTLEAENGKAEPAEEKTDDTDWEAIEAEIKATTTTTDAAEVFHRHEARVSDISRLFKLVDKHKTTIREMRGDTEPAPTQRQPA